MPVLSGELRRASLATAFFALFATLLGFGTAVGSAEQQHNLYRDETLGISFQYPGAWIDGAPRAPYSCLHCPILGPQGADPPTGVEVGDMPDAPSPSGLFDSPGCKISCFVGNNAREASEMVTLVVGGRDARQQEFDRSPPLPLAGKSPEYREVWTVMRGGRGLIFLVAFWPKQDGSLEAEVRSAYQLILASVQFTAPAALPAAAAPSVTLPGSGVADSVSRSRRELITFMAALLAVSGACVSFAGFSSRRKR
jgi:hypothetical protein